MATVLATPFSKSLEIGVLDVATSVDSHVANVNVGGSNPLTRFKQCVALARITPHQCGVYLFLGTPNYGHVFRTELHCFAPIRAGFGYSRPCPLQGILALVCGECLMFQFDA